MPDFTYEMLAHCESCEDFIYTAAATGGGSYKVTYNRHNPGPYQANWHCNCKGFQMKKTCRHIKEAQNHHCGWMEFTDGGSPTKDKKCPHCGGEIDYQRYAV